MMNSFNIIKHICANLHFGSAEAFQIVSWVMQQQK